MGLRWFKWCAIDDDYYEDDGDGNGMAAGEREREPFSSKWCMNGGEKNVGV